MINVNIKGLPLQIIQKQLLTLKKKNQLKNWIYEYNTDETDRNIFLINYI